MPTIRLIGVIWEHAGGGPSRHTTWQAWHCRDMFCTLAMNLHEFISSCKITHMPLECITVITTACMACILCIHVLLFLRPDYS